LICSPGPLERRNRLSRPVRRRQRALLDEDLLEELRGGVVPDNGDRLPVLLTPRRRAPRPRRRHLRGPNVTAKGVQDKLATIFSSSSR
jgi:hypothetical protein